MKSIVYLLVFNSLIFASPDIVIAQSTPSTNEVTNFFNNQNLLLTSRDGGVIYGTYYLIEIHYCPSGEYGLYARSEKRTITGNIQRDSWREYGYWKVKEQDGSVGLQYSVISTEEVRFSPIYKRANGSLFINESISIVNQGLAICN